jgi:CheY-like chemotaxis protein
MISTLRGGFFKKDVERYPKSEGKRETRRRFRNIERLTIMILKDVGEVRRFTISSCLVLFASLFFLFYIVATIYFTNKYFYTRTENKVQADKIAKLSRALIKTTKSLERSKQHIALLDDYVSESTKQSPEPEPTVNYTESPLRRIVDIPEKILKGKETILLVNDEDMIVDVGEEILQTLNKVLIVTGGKEAIKLYRGNKDKIDMVLLDMVMPDMGGGETYDTMKEINPDIKVLLSSGYSIDGQATEILRRGCDDFIQKPFNMKELSQRVREILDKE